MRARSLLPLAAAACATAPAAPPASVAAWPVVYRQDFALPTSAADFVTSDTARWRWSDAGGRPSLELLGDSAYAPPFRSPTSIALVRDLEVADFDLDADLLQTGRDYGHRDLCVFFGFRSPVQFYYVHLAQAPDANAHNVFRVDGAPRTNLAAPALRGIDWGSRQWHHVHVERRVGPGTIRVFWDGGAEPILTATCARFDWGRVGFGSFDDSGCIAAVTVRAPAARPAGGPLDPFAR